MVSSRGYGESDWGIVPRELLEQPEVTEAVETRGDGEAYPSKDPRFRPVYADTGYLRVTFSSGFLQSMTESAPCQFPGLRSVEIRLRGSHRRVCGFEEVQAPR